MFTKQKGAELWQIQIGIHKGCVFSSYSSKSIRYCLENCESSQRVTRY
jgi:hypothetical protein